MTPPRKSFATLLMIAALSLLVGIAKGQAPTPCRDAYNNALNYYNRGRFERVSSSLNNCFRDFSNFSSAYKQSAAGRDISTVYKVYKLIIASYRQLNQESLALRKTEELANFFSPRLSQQQVQSRLNSVTLTLIR